MTVTEALAYTLEVYVERGWLKAEEAKKIKRECSIISWGLFVVILLGTALFIMKRVM